MGQALPGSPSPLVHLTVRFLISKTLDFSDQFLLYSLLSFNIFLIFF